MAVTSWTFLLPRCSVKRVWSSFSRSAPPSLHSMTAWSILLNWSEKVSQFHVAPINAAFISVAWPLNKDCTFQARCFEEENISLEHQVAELRGGLNGGRDSISSISTATTSSLDVAAIRLRQERVGPAAFLAAALLPVQHI